MLKQIWWLLLLSIILVGTFIAIFYKTISTILYQKKLSDMKNDFISNITHEFKTPVSTISIACEALTDSDIVKTPAVAANYIQIIADENKRLGTMAEKILMASVLEEGKLQLKLAPCSMHEIISDCVQKVTLQAKNAGGSIQTQFDALHDLVHGDKLHLTSVVINYS
jgi:two-component system phosphate regulon sensor histidine kinase PhoR